MIVDVYDNSVDNNMATWRAMFTEEEYNRMVDEGGACSRRFQVQHACLALTKSLSTPVHTPQQQPLCTT